MLPLPASEPRGFRALRLGLVIAMLAGLLGSLLLSGGEVRAQSARSGALIVNLQERFGLNEQQVRGALGALLVYCRERLPQTEFDELAKSIPNAARIMQEVKLRGIVTAPLDDIDDFQETLASLGIGQPLASQFAPAVLEQLAAAGRDRERDILAGVLD
jgi:Protein of unknown function VcgC/VcgE (DUF2780)